MEIRLKTYNEKNNQLLEQVNFEKRLQHLECDAAVKVKLAADGKTITFVRNGKELHAKAERPIIHQAAE